MRLGDVLAPKRSRLIGAVLLVLAVAALAAYDVVMSRRVAVLEAAVAARDKVDPLFPLECSATYSHQGPGVGETRERPCEVDFLRLLQAPQQFDGRWVKVYGGRYERRYEVSALYPPGREVTGGAVQETADAIWVDGPVEPQGAPERNAAVGRFHRGPAGHLGAYFAELSDQ